ncbi:hypothetical protein [Micromonospora violae]
MNAYWGRLVGRAAIVTGARRGITGLVALGPAAARRIPAANVVAPGRAR